MRCYKILPVATKREDAKGQPIKPMYAGSQSESAEMKKQMQEAHGLKRTDVAVNPIDVPTDKAGLLQWLNQL